MPTISPGVSQIALATGKTLRFKAGGAGTAFVYAAPHTGHPRPLGAGAVMIGPFLRDVVVDVNVEAALSYSVGASTANMRAALTDGVALFDPFGVRLPSVASNSLDTPRNDVFLLVGDSIIDRGFTTPDITRACNFAHLANCLAGAPLYPVNGGVSGETTEQILARMPGLISTYSPAVILFGPNSVNDPSGNIPAAQSIIALNSMFDLALASGAAVIACTVHDGTLGSGLNVAASNKQRKWYRLVNSFIRDYAAGKPSVNPNGNPIYLHDFAQVADDPTAGGMKTGYDQAGDGRHMSFRHGYRQGRKLFDNIFSKLPLRNLRMPERFNPANLLGPIGPVVGNNATGAAGFLLGTGATGTGPNGYGYRRDSGDTVSTIDGTAGVTANADVAIGGNKATVTVTAGKDGGGGGIAIPQNSAVNRYSNPWAALTAYTWGNKVRISASLTAQVFTPGTSAAGAPDFTGLTPGDTLVDGSVTWMVTDRPKPGDKLRVLVDFDSSLASGSGGFYPWVAVTDTAGTATINTYALATTGADFATFAPYPDFSPFTSRTTLRHEFTIPPTHVEVGELSVRLFFVGANGSVATINCYGASLEIIG